MKKRAMKKWIPKGTPYCGNCRWRRFIKIIKKHRNINCEYANECEEECWTKPNNCCQFPVFKCEYSGYVNWDENNLLWCNGCKECGVSEISNKEYYFDKYHHKK